MTTALVLVSTDPAGRANYWQEHMNYWQESLEAWREMLIDDILGEVPGSDERIGQCERGIRECRKWIEICNAYVRELTMTTLNGRWRCQ